MKKVGLVSVRNYNYGSILQAFALQQELFAAGMPHMYARILFMERFSR